MINFLRTMQNTFARVIFDKWWGGVEGSQLKWEDFVRNWDEVN